MTTTHQPKTLVLACACAAALLTACGGGDHDNTRVAINAGTPNTVSLWDDIAASTINQPNASSGTDEEMQSNYAVDLATVHIAMYDAAIAFDGHYAPFAVTPKAKASGASAEVAVITAAYGVLKGLFPSRQTLYQPTYDSMLAAIPQSQAKTLGAALGDEVAAGVLKLRAHDGRATALKPFVPGTKPGEFRGPALAGRSSPFIRPFAMTSASQFRAPGPLALASSGYAADLNETASIGGSTSTQRTAAQSTSARFHTEAPPVFWPRNLRPLMMTKHGLADQARLGAMLWVAQADASIACFESKYHFLAWRPFSAINLADTDGNAATKADPAWMPYLPTPPHPEYPAAHACVGAASAEAARAFFGTPQVSFRFDSTVTLTTHRYATTDELIDDITIARIAGGMHFRHSIDDGAQLGRSVADWVVTQKFQRRL